MASFEPLQAEASSPSNNSVETAIESNLTSVVVEVQTKITSNESLSGKPVGVTENFRCEGFKCDENATGFCEKCKQVFCERHWQAHDAFLQHERLSLDDYRSTKERPPEKPCSQHPDTIISLACARCYAVFCEKCLLNPLGCHATTISKRRLKMEHDVWCLKILSSALLQKLSHSKSGLDECLRKLEGSSETACKELDCVEEQDRTTLVTFNEGKNEMVKDFAIYLNEVSDHAVKAMTTLRERNGDYQTKIDKLKQERTTMMKRCRELAKKSLSDIVRDFPHLDEEIRDICRRPLVPKFTPLPLSIKKSVDGFNSYIKTESAVSHRNRELTGFSISDRLTPRDPVPTLGYSQPSATTTLQFIGCDLMLAHCHDQPELMVGDSSLSLKSRFPFDHKIISVAPHKYMLYCFCISLFSIGDEKTCRDSIRRVNLLTQTNGVFIGPKTISPTGCDSGSIAVNELYIFILYGTDIIICSRETGQRRYIISTTDNQLMITPSQDPPQNTSQSIFLVQGSLPRTRNRVWTTMDLCSLTDSQPQQVVLPVRSKGELTCFSLDHKSNLITHWKLEGLSSPTAVTYDKKNRVLFCSSLGTARKGMIYVISREGKLIKTLTNPEFIENITMMSCHDGRLAVGWENQKQYFICTLESYTVIPAVTDLQTHPPLMHDDDN